MKRRIVQILIAGLALVMLLSLTQSTTIAQEQDPTASVEEIEPLIEVPDNTEALVTSAFTYQGRLKNSGAPVNTQCDFIWDIFEALTGGSSLASDPDANVTVANGLFTAVINIPSSVIDGSKRFVEIQVRCPTGSGAYTTLTPRQELYAVPYALGVRLPFSETISNSGSPIFAVTNNAGTTGSPSFLGSSVGGDGVRGLSTGAGSADNGVYGETNSPTTSEGGVKGVSTSSATGGYFTSETGNGVYGSAASATANGGYFSNPSATSGAALYANGDAKQLLTGDGFVKAGVYINDCGTSPTITSSFNNVNTTAITVIAGAAAGRCIVDFGFDASSRYIVVTSRSSTPRIVTFLPTGTNDRIEFFKFDAAGTLISGDILVLVY